MQEEKQKQILEALENLRDFNPNALELQETIFDGYLFNCSTGAEPVKEDVVLFNRQLRDLLKTIH